MKFMIAMIVGFLASYAACGEDVADKLLKDYETAVQKTNAERDDKVKKLTDMLVKQLQDEQTAATKRGDLDLALKIREQVKSTQANAVAGLAASAPAIANAPASPAKGDDGKLKAIPAGPRMPATFFVKSYDTFAVYVNGERLFSGGSALGKKEGTIAVGDVITIKASHKMDIGDGYGVACIIKAGKVAVTTNTTSWKSYIPKNDAIWFQPNQIDGYTAANSSGNQGQAEAVANATNMDCTSLWGTDNKVSYFFLQVTNDVFIPAK